MNHLGLRPLRHFSFLQDILKLIQVLHDIEERAPALKRQREEHEQAMQSLQSLESMMETEREMNASFKGEAELSRQRLETAGRENERLRKQVRLSFQGPELRRSGGLGGYLLTVRSWVRVL